MAEEFFDWARKEQEKNPVPKSMFGAALTYALNQRNWLMNVFLDGRLELSNNRAERAVRSFCYWKKKLAILQHASWCRYQRGDIFHC